MENVTYELKKIRDAFDNVKRDMVFLAKELDSVKKDNEEKIAILMNEIEQLKLELIIERKNTKIEYPIAETAF